jgi:hypothetical protein
VYRQRRTAVNDTYCNMLSFAQPDSRGRLSLHIVLF